MQKEYMAHPSTVCGAEFFTYADGKAKGVRAVRMYNGKLDCTVILDRAMDIFRLFYKGTCVSYISKNGLVSPMLCEGGAYGFLNSFDAGFLYTCGLDNIGGPVEKNGRQLLQHGSLSYIPAENVHVETAEMNGEYTISLVGEMHFTALFGCHLTLQRTISMSYLGDTLTVNDKVTNCAFAPAEYMLMYHSNIGYPLLTERAHLQVESERIDAVSENPDFENCYSFTVPKTDSAEEVFLHTVREGRGVKARLQGETLAMDVTFDNADFPYLVEWKSMACGEYVLGIEPSTMPMPEKVYRTIAAGDTDAYTVTWRFEEL